MRFRIKNRHTLQIILRMDTGLGLGAGIAGILLAKALPQLSGLPLFLILYLNLFSIIYGTWGALLFIGLIRNKDVTEHMHIFIKANWIRVVIYIVLIPIFIKSATAISLFYLAAIACGIAFLTYLEKRQLIKIKSPETTSI